MITDAEWAPQKNIKDTISALIALLVCLLGAVDELKAGGQLRQLRFSRDGKYGLAQDDSQIAVFSAGTLSILFRIPAENATLAGFTPDSSRVAFVSSVTRSDPTRVTVAHTPTRVERWDLHSQTRLPTAILPPLICGTVVLSADSRTVACLDFEGTLSVFDVDSAAKTLEIKKFSGPSFVWIDLRRYDFPSDLGSAPMQFSPDDRFLIAVPNGHHPTLIWDVRERRRIKPQGKLRMLDGGWNIQTAFLGPDQFLMSCGSWARRLTVTAKIVGFPSGKLSSTTRIPWAPELLRAADPSFLIVVHPYYRVYIPFRYGSYASVEASSGAVAVELATGHAIKSGTAALDVFGSHYIAEVGPGEVGYYEIGKGLQATLALWEK